MGIKPSSQCHANVHVDEALPERSESSLSDLLHGKPSRESCRTHRIAARKTILTRSGVRFLKEDLLVCGFMADGACHEKISRAPSHHVWNVRSLMGVFDEPSAKPMTLMIIFQLALKSPCL
jgi:hypothetical protein